MGLLGSLQAARLTLQQRLSPRGTKAKLHLPLRSTPTTTRREKNTTTGTPTNSPLSSVILNTKQIGFEAAALLNQLMSGAPLESSSIHVDPLGVMARQSTDVLAIDDPHVASALKHIREHACEGLDVGSLLKVVPLSRSVLERRFSQLLGKSPKAEILRVQLDRVCRLLAESDLPISEVADKAGFEHPEYMSRLFKKKIGMTPGEFRKRSGVRDSSTR